MSRASATEREAVRECGASRVIRIAIGAVLLALVLFPVYRLLDPMETGLAGRFTVGLLDIYYDFAWTGLLLVLPVAIIASMLVSPDGFARFSRRLSELLRRPNTWVFVSACALLGAVLTATFSLIVLEGKPNVIDAFAQMLQARYWAAGMPAGPTDASAPFWGIQNALFTDNGWVSQYPPGHVALLVPFFWLGAPWLLGPVLVFVTIVCTGLLAHRLFADDIVVARLATVLLAISPFFLFIGGSLMNHITTAAFVSLGAYALLRAWDGHGGWAVITGFAFALSLATRPLSTLALAGAWLIAVPFLWPRSPRRIAGVGVAGILGALPVLGAWFAYNQHFFGSPFTLGYNVALGPSMGLGFHRDPWGNVYGPMEALAYTSSDLITLGVNLFETPVSALIVIGAYFLFGPRLSRAGWMVAIWAFAPVLANALYWHHGLYMGPRMLHEAAPAWVLLFALAAVGLLRRIPRDTAIAGRYAVRPAAGVALLAAFVIGFAYLAPRRAISYGGNYLSIARTPLPKTPQPSLVFVHDAWYARLVMPLAASGTRLDLLETLIRQNPTCNVDEYTRAYLAGDTLRARDLLAALDTVPRASSLPQTIELAPGDNIRVADGQVLTGTCRREALSDRFGIIDISPLLWQADLHGTPGAGVLIARDLGPDRNATLLQMHPDRSPYVYVQGPDFEGVRLLGYDEGMQMLWSPPDSAGLLWRGEAAGS